MLNHNSQCSVWSLAYLLLLKLEWEFANQVSYWQQQENPQPAFNSHFPHLAATELSLNLSCYQLKPCFRLIRYFPFLKASNHYFQKPACSFFYQKIPLSLHMQRQKQHWQLCLNTSQGASVLQESVSFDTLYREFQPANR